MDVVAAAAASTASGCVNVCLLNASALKPKRFFIKWCVLRKRERISHKHTHTHTQTCRQFIFFGTTRTTHEGDGVA
jgi:hypothetical protein